MGEAATYRVFDCERAREQHVGDRREVHNGKRIRAHRTRLLYSSFKRAFAPVIAPSSG